MYDAIIIGGGIAGASMALSLGQLQYKTLLVEQHTSFTQVNPQDFEARTIGLSYASQRIFSALGVWDALSGQVVPIKKVVVSMQGQYGTCKLLVPKAYEALGYVVGQKTLEHILYHTLQSLASVDLLLGDKLVAKSQIKEGWQLEFLNHEAVACRLLIAADGSNSPLRETFKVGCEDRQYEHCALLTNLEMDASQPFTAFERFLPNGAIAILPWKKNYTTCVLTTTAQEALALKESDEHFFLARCQQLLGNSIGKIKACATRVTFPLEMKLATQQISARFLLLGNAAHSLHPIAAQGFNLTLRDIWQLRSQIVKAKGEYCDLGEEVFLREYIVKRQADQQSIIFATDKIARFMSGSVLKSPLRAAGLTLFDSIAPFKKAFTRFCMGLT